MKVKEITITVTRLIQTAPYESFQLVVSEVLELEPKDKESKVRLKKIDELMKLMDEREAEARETFKEKKKKSK